MPAPRSALPDRGVAAAPAALPPQRAISRVADADGATVESVRAVTEPAASTGIGTIGGSVLGGALGSQVGKGNGRTAMAALGAIGGGMLGHVVEQRVNATRAYDVTLRMDDGTRRTVRYQRDPGLQVGERVRTDPADTSTARGRAPAGDSPMVRVGAPA